MSKRGKGLIGVKRRTNATKHYLYNTWSNMRDRCYNKKYYQYDNYGGRGIRVCDRWLSEYGFWNFVEDMGDRPDGASLDRIDTNGSYSPSNCRWATIHEQQANRRDNTKRVGVHKHSHKGYVAELMVSGVRHNKRFAHYDDAVKQRRDWEREHLYGDATKLVKMTEMV